MKHLNRRLFKVVQNLKYDECEWVAEYLQNMYVYPNDDIEIKDDASDEQAESKD